MTFCKDAKDFRVESVLGKGCNGVVFSVKCVHPDFPASLRDKVLQAARCASLCPSVEAAPVVPHATPSHIFALKSFWCVRCGFSSFFYRSFTP
jgi:hypothetical protein